MENTEKNFIPAPNKDIGTLREILMGEYIRLYADNFRDISQHFAQNEAHWEDRFQQLHTEFDTRLNALEAQFNERVSQLEQHINHQIALINDKIDTTQRNSMKKLGHIFNTLSDNLDT